MERGSLNRWTPDHPEAQNMIRHNTRTSVSSYSTKNLFRGDYLKLKNLRLQYTFPVKTFMRFGVRNISLFLSGENLWIWTEMDDYDPEMQINGYRYTDRYPTAVTYTAGASISF
jgi:hypothetical protein